jgi:hypothetical protein
MDYYQKGLSYELWIPDRGVPRQLYGTGFLARLFQEYEGMWSLEEVTDAT